MFRNNFRSEMEELEEYLNEINAIPLISPADEVELAMHIRRGDKFALDKLVKANLRFVVRVAREYQGHGLILRDLVAEGNLGLIKAAQRFDETRGFKFISYAVWWIRQSILLALAQQSRIVRLPVNWISDLRKISKTVEQLEKESGRQPGIVQVADEIDMDISKADDRFQKFAPDLSFDKAFKIDNETFSLLNILPDNRYLADGPVMDSCLQQELDAVLATLTKREAEVIKLFFGLDGNGPLTLNVIGERFNLSRERVRQIKKKALKRLRHKTRARQLRQYLC